VIWLLDRQVEGVDRAVTDTIASTPQPKPSDSQARRMLENEAGLMPFSLAAVRVATKLMSKETTEYIERAMGYARSSIHPIDALPPHDAIPHPDLGGLRLWEGEQPVDEGTIDAREVGPVLSAAFALPGRDRLLISRASGIDQTTLSRMTRGSCKGVTRANLRILAHVLGLSPRVLGLEGPANVDPPTARPDLRYAGPFAEPKGAIRADASALLCSSGSYVLPTRNRADALEILDLTDPLPLRATEAEESSPPHDATIATTSVEQNTPRGSVRRIHPVEAGRLTAGVVFAVDPEGGSRFSLVGRMTTERLNAIATALDMPVEGEAPGIDETETVEIQYVGDDAVAARAYAALIAMKPRKRKWMFGS